MVVENVSGKFIRADSCCNENADLYQPYRRDNTVVEESNGPKIGSKIFDDDAAIEIVCARASAAKGIPVINREVGTRAGYLHPLMQPLVNERLLIIAR